MMTGPRSVDSGIAVTSSREIVISGCVGSTRVTISANRSRSTASAAPAGTRLLGRPHHQRAETPHLFFQQADGVVQLVAAEGIAADQFGEPIGLVNRRLPDRPHFVERNGNAPRGRLPGCLEPASPPPTTRITALMNHKEHQVTRLHLQATAPEPCDLWFTLRGGPGQFLRPRRSRILRCCRESDGRASW